MSLTIIWNPKALQQLEEAMTFIAEDSPANADKVRKKILSKIDELLLYPEVRAPDKFKTNNTGAYRAFEVYQYRISYFYNEVHIRIIRIRHTAMNPKNINYYPIKFCFHLHANYSPVRRRVYDR